MGDKVQQPKPTDKPSQGDVTVDPDQPVDPVKPDRSAPNIPDPAHKDD